MEKSLGPDSDQAANNESSGSIPLTESTDARPFTTGKVNDESDPAIIQPAELDESASIPSDATQSEEVAEETCPPVESELAKASVEAPPSHAGNPDTIVSGCVQALIDESQTTADTVAENPASTFRDLLIVMVLLACTCLIGSLGASNPIDDIYRVFDSSVAGEYMRARERLEIAEYSRESAFIIEDTGLAIDAIGRLALSYDPSSGNSAWKKDMNEQITSLKKAVQESRHLSPPYACRFAHRDLIQGMDKMDEAADTLLTGMEQKKPDKIEHASQLMEEGALLIKDALIKLEELNH